MYDTGWRRCIGCLKLQISFYKSATNFRALLRKMTYKDKVSYVSTPPCTRIYTLSLSLSLSHIWIRASILYARLELVCTHIEVGSYIHRSGFAIICRSWLVCSQKLVRIYTSASGIGVAYLWKWVTYVPTGAGESELEKKGRKRDRDRLHQFGVWARAREHKSVKKDNGASERTRETYSCMRIHFPSPTHSNPPPRIHTHTHTHTHTHALMHTCTNTHTRARTRTHTHTLHGVAPACIRATPPPNTHAYTTAHAHTHTHAHTYTHTPTIPKSTWIPVPRKGDQIHIWYLFDHILWFQVKR